MKKFFQFQNSPLSFDFGILILRLVASAIMLYHGSEKLFHYHDYLGFFPDPIGLGVTLSLILVIFAEVFCSILVVIGLFFRVALITLLIEMLVVFFIIHTADTFEQKELSLYFLGVYGCLFLTGPGKISMDYLFSKK